MARVFRYKVDLLPRATSDEKQTLEVISSSDTGAISLALFKIGDLHGKRYYPGEVVLLSEV